MFDFSLFVGLPLYHRRQRPHLRLWNPQCNFVGCRSFRNYVNERTPLPYFGRYFRPVSLHRRSGYRPR